MTVGDLTENVIEKVAEKVARALLEKDKSEPQGRTPPHHAADEGRRALVQALLILGADSSVRCSHTLTPLDLAVSRGHAEVVRGMVKLGADVNTADSHGRTALHGARWGYAHRPWRWHHASKACLEKHRIRSNLRPLGPRCRCQRRRRFERFNASALCCEEGKPRRERQAGGLAVEVRGRQDNRQQDRRNTDR